MVKTSQLVGLPVVTTGEGSIYGRVRDVSLAVNRKSVWGIMVERNNLMRTSRWIPYEGILLVGDVSILIKEGQRGVKQVPPDAVVLPKKARTLGGEDAGMVQDIWMDERRPGGGAAPLQQPVGRSQAGPHRRKAVRSSGR